MRDDAKLTCPKCKAPMRTYERNGIVIDQCTSCHGIFLDRGELERLIGIESSYLGQENPSKKGKSPRGFFGELFD
jgi:Zn-finger nucleic acid-binding protein